MLSVNLDKTFGLGATFWWKTEVQRLTAIPKFFVGLVSEFQLWSVTKLEDYSEVRKKKKHAERRKIQKDMMAFACESFSSPDSTNFRSKIFKKNHIYLWYYSLKSTVNQEYYFLIVIKIQLEIMERCVHIICKS